jgi:hypothetical protein
MPEKWLRKIKNTVFILTIEIKANLNLKADLAVLMKNRDI